MANHSRRQVSNLQQMNSSIIQGSETNLLQRAPEEEEHADHADVAEVDVGDQTWPFTYNHRNQLTSVEYLVRDPETIDFTVRMVALYVYDALGNRIEKFAHTYTGEGSEDTIQGYAYDGWN